MRHEITDFTPVCPVLRSGGVMYINGLGGIERRCYFLSLREKWVIQGCSMVINDGNCFHTNYMQFKHNLSGIQPNYNCVLANSFRFDANVACFKANFM